MDKSILAVSILLIAPLHSANLVQAHDRHQVIVEMRSGQTLNVDIDEWGITSLLDMDFVLDEMRKITDPSNPYSKEVQLNRLRSASAVLQHKSNLFDKMAISAAESSNSMRAIELFACNLALKDIDKKISNIVSSINEEGVVFDAAELDQSFGESFAQCVTAIKMKN